MTHRYIEVKDGKLAVFAYSENRANATRVRLEDLPAHIREQLASPSQKMVRTKDRQVNIRDCIYRDLRVYLLRDDVAQFLDLLQFSEWGLGIFQVENMCVCDLPVCKCNKRTMLDELVIAPINLTDMLFRHMSKDAQHAAFYHLMRGLPIVYQHPHKNAVRADVSRSNKHYATLQKIMRMYTTMRSKKTLDGICLGRLVESSSHNDYLAEDIILNIMCHVWREELFIMRDGLNGPYVDDIKAKFIRETEYDEITFGQLVWIAGFRKIGHTLWNCGINIFAKSPRKHVSVFYEYIRSNIYCKNPRFMSRLYELWSCVLELSGDSENTSELPWMTELDENKANITDLLKLCRIDIIPKDFLPVATGNIPCVLNMCEDFSVDDAIHPVGYLFKRRFERNPIKLRVIKKYLHETWPNVVLTDPVYPKIKKGTSKYMMFGEFLDKFGFGDFKE
jgi:hypothetical protein